MNGWPRIAGHCSFLDSRLRRRGLSAALWPCSRASFRLVTHVHLLCAAAPWRQEHWLQLVVHCRHCRHRLIGCFGERVASFTLQEGIRRFIFSVTSVIFWDTFNKRAGHMPVYMYIFISSISSYVQVSKSLWIRYSRFRVGLALLQDSSRLFLRW